MPSIGSGPEPGTHVSPWLDRYRTGELSRAEHSAVAAHLAACPTCEAELAELRTFADTVAAGFRTTAPTADRPASHWAAQRRAILERTAASGRTRSPGLARLVPHATVAVLALLAVGVVWRAGLRGPADAERRLSQREALGPAAAPVAAGEPADELGAAASDGERADVDALHQLRPTLEPSESDGFRGAAPPPEERRAERLELEGVVKNRETAADARRRVPPAPERGEDLTAAKTRPQLRDARVNAAPPADAVSADTVATEGADFAEEEFRREGRALDELNEREAQEKPAAAGAPAAVAKAPTTLGSDLSRFEREARAAVAERDSARAERALALWEDSLAGSVELTPDEERRGEALADSLEDFLSR